MTLEDVSIEKINAEILRIDEELSKVKELEARKQKLQKIVEVIVEFNVNRSNSMKAVPEITAGKPAGKVGYPFRTDQAYRRYQWFSKYPLLGFDFENIANCLNYIDGDSSDNLEAKSKEKMDRLQYSGRLDSLKRFLAKFKKDSEKAPAHKLEASAI